MKILLLQQPKSFSDYPEWIKEVQERFGRLDVMVFTSDKSGRAPSLAEHRHQGNRGF